MSKETQLAEGMVEPIKNMRLADGVAIGRETRWSGEELATVLVANFSDEAQKVPASANLGIC